MGEAHESANTPEDERTGGEVLELRVHGVNNTSPQGMLDLPETSVEEVLGDSLAGFYRPKPDALKSVHEGDRGWVPSNVTREAYSWGGLARSSPGGIGGGTAAKVTATIGRVAWTLLLPFGLSNIAYWTRRLDGGVPVEEASENDSRKPSSVLSTALRGGGRNGPGAGMIRVFGLGLTLLVIISACEVSMDLVGNQCFVDSTFGGKSATKVCGRLPGVAGFLGKMSAANRLVTTSLLPVALLLVFWLLASVTRARYERVTPRGPRKEPVPFTPYHFLQLPDFWRGDRMVGQAAKLHLAAGFAVVALALTWPAAFGPSSGCHQPTDLFGQSCWTQVDHRGGQAWTFVVISGAAIVVILCSIVTTWLSAHQIVDVSGASRLGDEITTPREGGSADPRRRFGGTVLLLASGSVFVAAGIAMLVVQPAIDVVTSPPTGDLGLAPPLLGVSALPTVVVACLFAFAVSGFMLRKISEAWLLGIVLLLAFTVVIEQGPHGVAGPCLIVVAIVATILLRTTAPRNTKVRLPGLLGAEREVSVDVLVYVFSPLVFALWAWALVVLWTETHHKAVVVACVVVALVLFASLVVESRGRPFSGFGRLPSGDRRLIAWRGTGPGMFLGLAFLAQSAVCSLVILVAGDWLNGGNSASTLLSRSIDPHGDLRTLPKPMTTDCGGFCPIGDPPLLVPRPYVLMGTGILLTLVLFVVLVGLMLVATRRAGGPPQPDEPPDSGESGITLGPEDGPPNDPHLNHYPAGLGRRARGTLLGKRRNAAVAHRAEAMVGYLTVIGLTVSFGVVLASLYPFDIWSTTSDFKPQWLWTLLQKTTNVATIALALVGAALLAALAGGATSANKRPLGLVWDLVCFLPRAAHPFSPPCYAERAVPELASRIDWWLADDRESTWVDSQRRRGERVVVSAHSLGGVLTVAALLASRPVGLQSPQVALLTYGCQLRAYFSRIFPELLGHHVLGVPAVRAGSFWRTDPWERELPGPIVPPDRLPPVNALGVPLGSVVDLLSPNNSTSTAEVHWRNLWRRTDYLGFPAYSYLRPGGTGGSPIDRMAQEIDVTSYLLEVGTHSDYPRVPQYLQMLKWLSTIP